MSIFINIEDAHPHLITMHFHVTNYKAYRNIEFKIFFLFLEILQYLEHNAF